jgi:hypothetical protein
MREAGAVTWLRSPRAVRERCEAIFAFVEGGHSQHFGLSLERLPAATDLTWQVTRAAYPDLSRIPVHGRVNHFAIGGVARLEQLEAAVAERDARARSLTALVVTSVLLDAGAGHAWHYTESPSGLVIGRSEGLAVASFHAFASGLFSGRGEAWQADAGGLTALDAAPLGQAFQVTSDNPLVGLEGRAALLRALGSRIREAPALFASSGTVGGLYDVLRARAKGGRLPAASVLELVLEALGPIWPPRTQLAGVELGDVWPHRAAGGAGLGAGLVPFHKLSQWLSYSLMYPLQAGGIEVTDVDGLTGLADYRNGGLFVDSGVIVPKYPGVVRDVHAAGSELVVEWRALTVALLDRLAAELRTRLGLDAERLPLAKVLEGGTWAAGRRLAAELRQGAPPIAVESDGTLF